MTRSVPLWRNWMVTAMKHETTMTRFHEPDYDRVLALSAVALVLLGWVMVSSSSFSIAHHLTGDPWHFSVRHGIYLVLGFGFMLAVTSIPLRHWAVLGPILLICGLCLLVLVLIVGKEVNGSRRWLSFGIMNLQVAELVKLFVVVYLANYLVRRAELVQTRLEGFVRPLLVMGAVTVLLLLQPDFGSAAVIVATVLAMMFLGGARLWQFIVLLIVVIGAMAFVATSEAYRVRRLTSFLDPWADPFRDGYQLVQSLIAFGRGGVWGSGLGDGVQKMAFLPEPHTDFIVSVIAEELGLIGLVVVVVLFTTILWRALSIGRRALKQKACFTGYLCYGLGFSLFSQAMVNIGVASGLLPTKGLTLPLVSYGGSSLLISMASIGLLLRADFETRHPHLEGAR